MMPCLKMMFYSEKTIQMIDVSSEKKGIMEVAHFSLKCTPDHLCFYICFSLVHDSSHVWNLGTECQILCNKNFRGCECSSFSIEDFLQFLVGNGS